MKRDYRVVRHRRRIVPTEARVFLVFGAFMVLLVMFLTLVGVV